MSITAIGPSWGAAARGWPYAEGRPELTITVQVTVSGSVVPGVTTQVLQEIQEFADRMNGAGVTLIPAVEPDRLLEAAAEHNGHRPEDRHDGDPAEEQGGHGRAERDGQGPRLCLVPAARVVLLDSAPVQLTRREFDLLLFLCRNRLRVVSREELLTEVWEYEWTGGSRTVDVHIRRLRVKLGAVFSTVHGVGYRVDDRVRVTVQPAA
jgi:two-component system, OmpR family, response regulator